MEEADPLGAASLHPLGAGTAGRLRWVLAVALLGVAACVFPPDPPEPMPTAIGRLWIDTPTEDALLSGVVVLAGRAEAVTGVFKVEVGWDDGPLRLAEGQAAWSYTVDTRQLVDGERRLRVVLTDTRGRTLTVERAFSVENGAHLELGAPSLGTGPFLRGEVLTAKVTITNVGRAVVALDEVALEAVPLHGGPALTLGIPRTSVELQPGAAMELQGRGALGLQYPLGEWRVRAVYRTGADGSQLEGDSTGFTLERQVRLAASGTSGRLLSGNEPLYVTRLRTHFDGLTPDFELKMATLQPWKGEFAFEGPDRLVDQVLSWGKQVRGHTLVWHRSLPTWVTERLWSREALAEVLVTHVRTVVGHYRGRISEWDVVNEALNDDGTWRDTIWYRVLGEEYVALAFRAAHEADPEALLYYNDYNAERINAKSTAILALVQRLRAEGVPIHGVGFQSHVSINYNPSREQLRENLARFEAAGMLTQLTELDVRTANAPGLSLTQRLERQAEIYGAMTLACLDSPGCVRITSWGITDKFATDGTTELPNLFDAQYAPKPAWSVVEAALDR